MADIGHSGGIIPGGHVVINVSGGDQTCPGGMVGIYIGGTGNIAIEDLRGIQQTYTSIPVGFHAMRMGKILQTGTTVTNSIILFQ